MKLDLIRRSIQERFGDPLIDAGSEALTEAPVPFCEGCGCMMQLEGETCSQCGMMETDLDQVAPPGREKQVKALKKDKNVDNPWAVAWSSWNKSHKK